MESRTI